MSQILLHSKDNESVKSQLTSATIGLKSIVGEEKKNFKEISETNDKVSSSIVATASLARRVNNIINNLTVVTNALISFETIMWLATDREQEAKRLLQDIDGNYAAIPDEFVNSHGGRI